MKPTVDWRLYLVTDRGMTDGRPLEQVVEEAVRGGVTVVQLREKDTDTRSFLQLARHLKERLDPYRVPLIINDRVDIALACGAAGVHLGQRDMPPATARALLGPDAVIGLSIEHMADLDAAQHEPVDYLGVSPIFSTPTKTDTTGEWGLAGLRAVRAATAHPLIAIGRMQPDNVADVLAAGADGIAVVSAICAAPDPVAAARQLRRLIDAAAPS
jgi:thiamine-phosphate pyrophosphorylase